ncbi:unnamed protein product, partial [Mesorhabditis spiculigera]
MDCSTSSSSTFPADEWNEIVVKVLNVWSGYQLGVHIEAGGPETRTKHEWFANVLAEHIRETKGLKADSLEEWMESILYSDFDLVLEDDSTYPTARLLLELYGYLKNNNRASLQKLLATLPSEESIRSAQQAARAEGGDGESTSGDDDDDEGLPEEDEEMMDDGQAAQNGQQAARPPRERQPKTVTDDDGWTTIVKRN